MNKERVSRIVIVLVCVVTSCVFGVLYVNRYVLAQPFLPEFGEGIVLDTTASADYLQQETNPTPVPQPITVLYSTLPRYAYRYDGVVCNNTGTEGEDALYDYYCFGGYVYVVVGTGKDGCDYQAEVPSLALARFDEGCVLIDTVVLPQSAGCRYLCASLYEYGIAVVGADSTQMRVWLVSANMVVQTISLPYRVSAARLVYDNGNTVLSATGDKLHMMSLGADGQVRWYYAVDNAAQQVVALYAYGQTYAAVCSAAHTGAAYLFGAKGFGSKCVLSSVDCISPYRDGYVVACIADNALYWYDYTFTKTGQTSIARAVGVQLCSYDNGVLLLAESVGIQGQLYCNHGDLQYSFSLNGASLAGDVMFYRNRFWFDTQEGDGQATYSYVPFAAAPLCLDRLVGAQDAVMWLAGAYRYCLCTSNFTYGYFSGNCGGRDVFLLRNDLS